MLTLGIETSTNTASVALMEGDQLLAEQILSRDNVRHAQTLVHELDLLLQEKGLHLKETQRVAVSIGPGSFTGLRIGLVFAKTLAYITKCELVPVDTLLAIAANSPAEVEQVYAVVDAQRGDLYVAPFQRDASGGWSRTADVRIVPVKTWVTELSKSDVISGPGLQRHLDLIATQASPLPESFWIPRAAEIARLGSVQPTLSTFEQLAALEPFYLRKSAAEENWVKKQTAQ